MAGRLREPMHKLFVFFAQRTRRDLLIGSAFTLAGALEDAGTILPHPARLVGAVPILAALFSISLRRQRPLLPLAAITTVAGLETFAASLMPTVGRGGPGSASIIFGTLFAVFSLGLYGSRRELALGAPLPLLMITLITTLDPSPQYPLAGGLAFTAVFVVGAPLLVGRLLRDRSRLVADLRQQETLLHAEAESSAEAARAGEKLELAAQMQAILATGMLRLVAQVNIAQDFDKQDRLSAVSGIEAMARKLLGELGHVLASISPGIDHSPWTVERRRVALDRARASSLDVDFSRTADGQVNAARGCAQLLAMPRWEGAHWDLMLAAILFAGLAFQALTNSHLGVAKAVGVLACFAVAAPLSLASRRPLLSVAATTVGAAIFSITVVPLTDLFTAISLLLALPFVVGAFEDRPRALVGLGVCLLSTLAARGLDSSGLAPLLVGAWLAGRVLRDRNRLASALRETNRRLVVDREENDRRIVLEERARLAREVHDVVGHSLTVVALQAGAARRLWDRDRSKAEQAMVTIAQVVEAGMRDLNRGDDLGGNLTATLAEPNERLEIDDLVDRARLAGLKVRVQVNGSKATLNPAAELAAYRLVQEALTNVLKHVPGAAAEISLRYVEAGLEVAVNNPINALPPVDPITGRGLRGMRERVSACGGTLEWGPNPAGRFEVRAWFPVPAPAR
jgi:signal transduction histidine kinase